MKNSLPALHSPEAAYVTHDRLDAALDECGLSVDTLTVLHCLVEAKDPPALGELDRLPSIRSNVIRLIGFLQAEGLVQPVSDDANSSMARMAITEVGRQRYEIGQALSELAWEPG